MLNLKIPTVVIGRNDAELMQLNAAIQKQKELSVVGRTTSAKLGVSLIHNYSPQLVFVDVDLPEAGGLELVRILHRRNIFPEIVFVADNEQKAFESMTFEPLDFLLKPVRHEMIAGLLENLKRKLKKKELLRKMDIYTSTHVKPNKRVFIQKKGIIVVKLEEIVFLKAELISSVLSLNNGEKIKLKTKLTETMETINDEGFIKIGRSYIINTAYLRKIDKKSNKCYMYFEGKSWVVPVSKNIINHLEELNVYPIF